MRTSDGAHPDNGIARLNSRIDLKLVRMAVHGWWLGNPLVYKPEVDDLFPIARELARAGAAPGTVVLGDGRGGVGAQAVLILRAGVPRTAAGLATALSIADVTRGAIGTSCTIRGTWDVVIETSQPGSPLCSIGVEANQDATLVGLTLALERFGTSAQRGDPSSMSRFTRSDWREVFLARVLHALDGRLQALPEQQGNDEPSGAHSRIRAEGAHR